MAEYVSLSEQDFQDIFRAMQVEARVVDNPNIREIVYQIPTENSLLGLRIFSSLEKSTKVTRGVGEDAIRLVFWHVKWNHPLNKGIRIYRVTSKESVQRRIEERIREFLNQVPMMTITDWDYVRAVLRASAANGKGEFAKSLLENLEKFKGLTENQLVYVLGDKSPKGYPTMEANLKRKGWIYDPVLEDDESSEKGVEKVSETVTPTPSTASEESPPENTSSDCLGTQIEIISDTEGMELKSTEGCPYKFPLFNPVQTLTFPFKDEDSNLVIGANTSAGKTICGELLIDACLAKGKKVIYLSPLKALTSEKYEDWKERYSQFKISILTGDYTLSKKKSEELQEAHIITMTSEMMDSRTRRMETEKNYWLKDVGLVIVDESHILSTSRGHPVESGIMRFTSLNRDARILFLSATMPNVDQLGKWLTSLNGKSVRVIYSTWRPVVLNINYIEYHAATDRWGRPSYWAAQEAKKSLAVDLVKSKPDEKFLVFTHDKGTGNQIVSRLKSEGIESKFHNADLDREERKDLEASFRQREGGLRVMVSTSTTAWGVNLPARNVIIVGIHRGIQEVDQLDIIQMSGRAGRYGIDDAGFVYLLIPEGSTGAWRETFAHPRPVTSVMCNHHILAFHVLAEIQNMAVKDARSLLKWYSRSLAYLQGLEFGLEDAQNLLDDLEKMEMVIHKSGYYSLTGLGKVSGWLYYSPYDIYAWYKNFDRLLKKNDHDLDDLELAWAITDTPDRDFGYIPKDMAPEVEDLRWKLRNRGIQASDAIVATLAAYKSLGGLEMEGQVKTLARTLKYDINRIVQALTLIDGMYAKWDCKEIWNTLVPRIIYGIPEEMTPLVRLTGVGGVKAKKMWEAGIRGLQDVIDKPEVLKRVFQPAFAHKLRIEARQLLLQPKEG